MGCTVAVVQHTHQLLENPVKNDQVPHETLEKEGTTGIRSNLVRHKNVNDIFSVFNQIKVLGEGMSGCVFEVSLKSNPDHLYALKQMRKVNLNPELLHQFMSEIALLSEMDHPNVIKLYDTYEDEGSFYLCMEECLGGELFDYLMSHPHSKLTESYACNIVTQMLYAVNYLHSKTVCHRDLKLENFVFESKSDESLLKLIDFGLSCRYHGGLKKMKSLVGTPYYMAPEVLKQQDYGLECDVWSLGVITYMLVSGIPPFNGSNQMKIMERATIGKYEMPEKYFANISLELKDFINQMLVVDRKKRFTTRQLIQHAWIKKFQDHSNELSQDVLQSFLDYSTVGKLKKAALEAIAFNLNMKEINDLRNQFLLIDQDGNGTITLNEMKDALQRTGLSPEKSEEIFRSIDTNNTGLISYSEFIAASLKKRIIINESTLIDAFKRLDTDGNGYLEIDDFKKLMGEEFDEQEVRKMIEAADSSKDGRIDFQEFIAMMNDVKW